MTIKETKFRSAIKALSYIVIHEIVLLAVTFAFTRDIMMSAGIVLTGSLLEAGYYYLHERVWAKIKIERKSK